MSVVCPHLMETPTITAMKLNRCNYFFWKTSVKMWFFGQGVEDHLTEDPPTYLSDTDVQKWKRVDAQLLCLLWQSIELDLGDVFFLGCQSCKSFWKAAKDMDTIGTRAYVVVSDLLRVRHDDKGLTAYYIKFCGLMAELKDIFPFSSDPKTNETQQEQLFALIFLHGLNPKYEFFRAEILKSPTLPTLKEVYFRIRHACPDSWYEETLADRPALATPIHGQGDSSIRGSHGRGRRDGGRGNALRPRCSYCNKWGHVRGTCWTLHGQPPR